MPTSPQEENRLKAVDRIGELTPRAKTSLDDLVELVSVRLRLPIVAVTIIGRREQVLLAQKGLSSSVMSRDFSIGVRAIKQGRTLVIGDTLEEPLTRENPLVTGAPNIRSYIGCPLEVEEHVLVGVLAVSDREPRKFTQKEIYDLERFALLASGVLSRMALRKSLEERERQSKTLQRAQKQLAEALSTSDAARKQAESSSRAKGRFLAVVSHEIRTPLHGIMGCLSELRHLSQGGGEQLEFIGLAESCSKELLATIDQILEVSSGETAGTCIRKKPFFIEDSVSEIRKLCAPMAAARKLDFEVSSTFSSGDCFLGDLHCIKRVLTNLVVNAFKYTKEGRVALKVQEQPDPLERPHHLLIVANVVDTGIGISQQDLERIFWPFEQIGEMNTRAEPGVGLGLSIAREMVESMGGSISVSSEPRRGSAFTVTIPVERLETAAADRREPAPTANGEQERPSLRVLLVDDQETMLILGQKMLNRQGISPDVARNGREALHQVERGNDYDLILMDLRMPEMDGLEATRKIRDTTETTRRPAPVISGLTAHGFEDSEAECYAAGMDRVYTKPFSSQQLIELLEEVSAERRG